MKDEKAKYYLTQLEQKIMINGFKQNMFKVKQPEIVPLRKRKLHNTDFSVFVGPEFECGEVLAFNFYGLFKLSTGASKVVKECKLAFPNIRTMKARVVHFNSIKMEHVKELAPELLEDFPDFKNFLVGLRKF